MTHSFINMNTFKNLGTSANAVFISDAEQNDATDMEGVYKYSQ